MFKWSSFQAFKATLTCMTENRQTHLMIIKSCQCTFCILQLSLYLVTAEVIALLNSSERLGFETLSGPD